MKINALRVQNAIHNLGLTEKQIAKVEQEQNEKWRRGIAIMFKKKGVFICVNHDNKHNIVIWNKNKFYGWQNDKKVKIKPNSRVLFKTLITFDFPPQINTLHTIGTYRSGDSNDVRYQATNIEELKERVRDRFSDNYGKELGKFEFYSLYGEEEKKERYRQKRFELIKEQLKAVFWLFNEPYDFEPREVRANVNTIIKAFQKGNKRVAIIQKHSKWETNGGFRAEHREYELNEFSVRAFKHTDLEYNYVNTGREFSGNVWVSDELLGSVTSKELDLISSKSDRSFLLLTMDKYHQYKTHFRTEMLRLKRKEKEERIKNELVNKIQNDFQKKGEVIRQGGVRITTNSITQNGLTFKAQNLKDYIISERIYLLQEISLKKIYGDYLDRILKIEVGYFDSTEKVYFIGKHKIQIGKIKIKIEENKGRIKINDITIRKDEVKRVLLEAFDSKTQKQYQDYLIGIKKCSLRMRRLLNEGIDITLRMPRSDDIGLDDEFSSKTIFFSIKPIREGQNYYVNLGDKKFRIKRLSPIYTLDGYYANKYNGDNADRIFDLLFQALEDVSANDIVNLMTNGVKAFEEREKEKARLEEIKYKENARKEKVSLEFIENAVKITHAEKREGGWIVTGTSGTQYWVTNQNQVYLVEDDVATKYLCLVDMDSNETKWQKNDAIAKRILALSKDMSVAKEIWEQGDKMDKHWLNLMIRKEAMTQ